MSNTTLRPFSRAMRVAIAAPSWSVCGTWQALQLAALLAKLR